MRKIRLLPILGCLTITVYLLVNGCLKPKTAVEDTSFATDHATTEQSFTDVQTISDQAASVSNGSLGYRTTATTGSGCATVTHTGDSIIINFGTSDCMCHDGRTRRGEIIVTYTGGSYFCNTPGSMHTITFNDFFQDDNKITGTKTVTYEGTNSANQPYYNVVINGAVNRASGGTITASWTRVRTWVTGYDSTGVSPIDVYNITGSGAMTTANGVLVDVNIPAATPLVVANDCHWIEAGTVVYTFGGHTRTLNYGTTPVCDDQATLTLDNGTIKNITLP